LLFSNNRDFRKEEFFFKAEKRKIEEKQQKEPRKIEENKIHKETK